MVFHLCARLSDQCQPGNFMPKKIPTPLTADPDLNWLSAPHTAIGGEWDNYRGTLTQIT